MIADDFVVDEAGEVQPGRPEGCELGHFGDSDGNGVVVMAMVVSKIGETEEQETRL